jgi:hypothetical protein
LNAATMSALRGKADIVLPCRNVRKKRTLEV